MSHIRIGRVNHDAAVAEAKRDRFYSFQSEVGRGIWVMFDDAESEVAVVEGDKMCIMSEEMLKELHDMYEVIEHRKMARVKMKGA